MRIAAKPSKPGVSKNEAGRYAAEPRVSAEFYPAAKISKKPLKAPVHLASHLPGGDDKGNRVAVTTRI